MNGHKVDRPSFSLKVGDVVTFKDKIQPIIRDNMESIVGHLVSDWLEFTPADLSIRAVALPMSEQVPFDVNTNLIVEFYR